MFKISKEFCFFGALILVAVSLPFSFLLINTLSIWLLIFFWIINNSIKEKIEFLKKNKLIWLFSSLFIAYFLGLIYGDFKLGLFEVEKRLSLLIFPLVLGTTSQISPRKLRIILASFAFSCIIISIICLIYTFYTNHLKGITYYTDNRFYFSNLTEVYGFHSSYFSIYIVFSIFILLFIWFENKNIGIFYKLSIALIIIYLIVFIFLLASRIGLISIFILSVFGLLFYSYQHRKLLYGFIIALLFTVAILFSLQFSSAINSKFKGLLHLGTENREYSGSGIRLDLWQTSLLIIKDNLLLGVGTGNLQPTIQNVFKTRNFSQPYQNYLNPHNKDQLNSHNQFLDIAGTLGLIGGLLFLSILFIPIYLSFKNKHYLYVLFILLFIFFSMVEVPLATQKGVVWYAFFNSLLAFHFAGNRKIE